MVTTAKVALISGAGKRLGATIATRLHQQGYNVVVHYRQAAESAEALCSTLNTQRDHSAITLQADLSDSTALQPLISQAVQQWGQLGLVVNNAAAFYPTPLTEANVDDWQLIFNTNVRAPFFLVQAAIPHLEKVNGNVINIVDIHAEQPLKNFSLYCMSKAALLAMTRSMAKELGPAIRINGIAPGMVAWPNDDSLTENARASIIKRIALKRAGSADNIAETVCFIVNNDYLTGEIIHVDGGRLLHV
ncbi:MAG: pteridine reductase [Gammaproteobacteria bacterium]|nr:pteridine reductase [Gammaproteobacteria bacterium]